MQRRPHSATVSTHGGRNSPPPWVASRTWRTHLGVAVSAALVGFLAVLVADLRPFDWIQKTLTEWQGRRPTPIARDALNEIPIKSIAVVTADRHPALRRTPLQFCKRT
jgi:hypothetical protein